MTFTSVVFAQSVSKAVLTYVDNWDEREFRGAVTVLVNLNASEGLFQTQNIPITVQKDINSRLKNYNLTVGDIFIYIAELADGKTYSIYIRITNRILRNWEYFAFLKV
jgi:hypothetical protein